MEQKFNIAKILKNKPRGTKLYSIVHGKCSFEAVTDEIFKINFCNSKFGLAQTGECALIKFGNIYDGGECIIFPSKEMRDWSKFAWQKGDVLVSNDGGIEVIFNKWYDDTYTNFYCKHYFNREDDNKIVYYKEFLCTTARYSLENKTSSQIYIKTIEEKLGGKLNCETLEIEKAQPEFKDGDIVVAEEDNYYDKVIFIAAIKDAIVSRVLINVRYEDYEVHYNEYRFGHNRSLRLATDSERRQLFEALAKENKAWDAEKKMVVDLKPKCEFKPFDKVLGRNEKDDIWEAELFSHYKEGSSYPFRCIGFSRKYCIPYEGNEHLLGTKNNPEQHNLHDTE